MPAVARGELFARASSVGVVMGGDGPVDRWGAVPAGVPRAGPPFGAQRIALDHVGGSGDNWSVMIPLVPFAARSRST